MKKTWLLILVLILLSVSVRLIVALNTCVIASDGPVYIKVAQDYYDGNFRQALDHSYHPVYPLLISVLYWVLGNWEWAGIVISMLLSSLVVIPLYYIGKQVFDKEIAVVACILYAFLPHAARLSAQVLTTGTFIFFLIMSIWLFMLALKDWKYRFFFLAGISALLAYFSRPDGIIILPVFILWVILQDISNWRLKAVKQRIITVFMLILPGLVLVLPYCLYKGGSLTGKFSMEQTGQMLTVFFSGKEYGHALTELIKDLRVFHPLLGIFLLVGIFKQYRHRGTEDNNSTGQRKCAWLIWLVFVAYLLAVFSFTVVFGRVSKRYTTPLTVLSIFWAASGLFSVSIGLARVFKHRQELVYSVGWLKGTVLVVVIILCFTVFIPIGRHRLPEKEVGEWIREYHKTQQTQATQDRFIVMADSNRISYYAGGESAGIMPWISSYEGIIAYARRMKALYLVINKKADRFIPDFTSSISPEDLQPLGFAPKHTLDNPHYKVYKIVLK
ncbi:glycosyltransferase family 39 protein [Planctomycetota bacterium]